MRKNLLYLGMAILFFACNTSKLQNKSGNESAGEKKKDKYANAFIREKQQFESMMDPALGYVPYQRLAYALDITKRLKEQQQNTGYTETIAPLIWEERGPIYDSVGPSNGNGRGGGTGSTLGGYTSGRIRAFLLDTLNDASGNTAYTGGVAGGLWKCTDFLSVYPTWKPVDDFMSNLTISSIAQDPTNPQVLYFSTGEPTSNADAVYGMGVWKSVNGGNTFALLPSTSNFLRTFKIGCDAAGNVYLATRITTIPVSQSRGLFRSTNGGTSWIDITPDGLTAGNNTCTDFEFTASGKLNATFGYLAPNNIVNHRYTANPATVTAATWSNSTGFRPTNATAIRTEMAVSGEVLYAITINTFYHTDSCYKSIDGGQTWTKQNTTVLPTGLGSQQGWYNLSLAINPLNTDELISGGLDAYRSINGGANWTRFTYWVSTAPYVHADHHYAQYWITGGQTRLIMATDGGIYYSTNNGSTFTAKNKFLGIKQFYSAAIHPDAGSPYLLAGAQDNGSHQLKYPGLSYSIEVTGGDGCFVHINQKNPQIQFASYVYNQYRRSVNGGNTWSSANLSGSQGLFVNPFDYDDDKNILYGSNGATGAIRRWVNANTAAANTSTVVTMSNMGATASITSVKYSPYTENRVYFGTNNGRVYKLDNANTVVTADANASLTQISNASFPSGTVMCVNTGTDDNNIVAVYSNYGVNNVWITKDGGTTWTAIDGNLPDMPVRWAIYEPGSNDRLFLATEAGIYTSKEINGTGTIWMPEVTFPAVRTDMLKLRASDSTIVAGTHGRGLWTAKMVGCLSGTIVSQPVAANVCQGSTASFTVGVTGTVASYRWQVSTDGGLNYTNLNNGGNYSGVTTSTLVITNTTLSMNGYYYRIELGASGGCPSGFTTPAKLSVSSVPVPVLTLASYSGITPYVRASFNVTVSPSGNYSYQWYKNSFLVPSLTSDRWNVTVDDFGEYQVEVTDLTTGCKSVTNKVMLKDSVSNILFIYPNPSSGVFIVRYHSPNSTIMVRNLNVYDAKGARVYSSVYNINRTYDRMEVNLKNASAGVYMLELTDANGGVIATSKIVIRK